MVAAYRSADSFWILTSIVRAISTEPYVSPTLSPISGNKLRQCLNAVRSPFQLEIGIQCLAKIDYAQDVALLRLRSRRRPVSVYSLASPVVVAFTSTR